MAVIHVFKDGTTTTELKDVLVPKEIIEQLINITRKKGQKNDFRQIDNQ